MDPVAYSFASPSRTNEMQLNARRHAGCGCDSTSEINSGLHEEDQAHLGNTNANDSRAKEKKNTFEPRLE